jgi:hypothetical protein
MALFPRSRALSAHAMAGMVFADAYVILVVEVVHELTSTDSPRMLLPLMSCHDAARETLRRS